MTSKILLPQNTMKSFILTSSTSNIELDNWKINSQQLNIKNIHFSIQQICLHGRKQKRF